jgi:hypothetical protein
LLNFFIRRISFLEHLAALFTNFYFEYYPFAELQRALTQHYLQRFLQVLIQQPLDTLLKKLGTDPHSWILQSAPQKELRG